MKLVFTIIQIILSICLIALILLQSSKGGLGSAFGGGELYRTKRGAEKIVFTITIVVSILFLFASILSVIVR